jgi:hypothetical protein
VACLTECLMCVGRHVVIAWTTMSTSEKHGYPKVLTRNDIEGFTKTHSQG